MEAFDSLNGRRGAAPQRVRDDRQSSHSAAARSRTRDRSRGCTLWFTGMSGTGKTTVSGIVAGHLRALGHAVEVLDGDVVRSHLCRDLGFSYADREENIRRIGYVCELLSRHGVMPIVAAISPYRASREQVRRKIGNFVEIYMQCPMHVLIERDVKGLYRKALAGEVPHFTGISDPYEPPLTPEIAIDSSLEPPERSAMRVLAGLRQLGIIHSAGER